MVRQSDLTNRNFLTGAKHRKSFFNMVNNLDTLSVYAKQLKSVQTTLEALIKEERNEPFFDNLIYFANEVHEHFNVVANMIGYEVIENA